MSDILNLAVFTEMVKTYMNKAISQAAAQWGRVE
jgi:hypothetical protein